ncbi:MAG: MAPEG family protein [Pseudomonadota bacterium]
MTGSAILQPALILAGLTVGVAAVMTMRRAGDMRRMGRALNALPATRGGPAVDWSPRTQAASDNFNNLLETPVLFYVAMIALALSGGASGLVITFAWAYVAARAIHTGVHLTYNLVSHRFAAFALSMALLTAILVLATVSVF